MVEVDRPQCSNEQSCAAVQLLVYRTTSLEELLEKMQDRLPPYITVIATVATAVFTAIISVLATLLTLT